MNQLQWYEFSRVAGAVLIIIVNLLVLIHIVSIHYQIIIQERKSLSTQCETTTASTSSKCSSKISARALSAITALRWPLTFAIVGIISNIMYGICIIIELYQTKLYQHLYNEPLTNTYSHLSLLSRIVVLIGYFVALCSETSLLCFEVCRLYNVFKDESKYAINKCSLNIFITTIAIITIIHIFNDFTAVINGNLYQKIIDVFIVIYIISIVFAIILPVVVTIMFFIKLDQLVTVIRKEEIRIIMYKSSNFYHYNRYNNVRSSSLIVDSIQSTASSITANAENNENENMDIDEYGHRNANVDIDRKDGMLGNGDGSMDPLLLNLKYRESILLHNVIKQSLLTLIETIFFPLWHGVYFTCRLYVSLSNNTDDANDLDKHFLSGWHIIVVFDSIITCLAFTVPSICVWLSFPFAAKQYEFACIKCHECCFNCRNTRLQR